MVETILTEGQRNFRTNLAVLSGVLICESLSATMLIPFVGLYVSHLEHISPNDAGYLSGLLVAMFQLGQVLTGKLWGAASDRVGRKSMIQFGLFANAVVAAFFGMSPNIVFCVVMRLIHGCANGNVLVAKTVIADITTKETEGAGFAAISIFWGVGSIVGPALGGWLYDPAEHAVLGPLLVGTSEDGDMGWRSVFADHPAFLPCLVISVTSVVTLFAISILLPETSKGPIEPFRSLFPGCGRSYAEKGREWGIVMAAEEEDDDGEALSATTRAEHVAMDASGGLAEAPDGPRRRKMDGRRPPPLEISHPSLLSTPQADTGSGHAPLDQGEEEKVENEVSKTLFNDEDGNAAKQTPHGSSTRNRRSSFGYREALQLPSTRLVLLMYMCIASTECALLEVIPLWTIAEHDRGGLEFSSSDNGTMMMVSSVVYVVANLFFGRLTALLGGATRPLWDFSVIFWAFTCILTPCCAFIEDADTQFKAVATITSLREVGLSWSYSLIYMYVVRSAPSESVGSMNGIAQAIGSFSRMLTMLVIPPLFAWSLNTVGYPFPFNFNLVFWVTSVPLLASFFLSSLLPMRVTDHTDK